MKKQIEKAVKAVSYAACKDKTRPHLGLMGVYILEDTVIFICTDDHRAHAAVMDNKLDAIDNIITMNPRSLPTYLVEIKEFLAHLAVETEENPVLACRAAAQRCAKDAYYPPVFKAMTHTGGCEPAHVNPNYLAQASQAAASLKSDKCFRSMEIACYGEWSPLKIRAIGDFVSFMAVVMPRKP